MLNKLAKAISEWRINQGFYTPPNISTSDNRDAMLGKLMLVVTEISEAAEAVRFGDEANFQEELADTFIRLFDICGTCDINVENIITWKMEINKKRLFRHGKLCRL